MAGLEACATAHYWARELAALGHELRVMPAQYVKAYIKRNKHDAADAEAICEAVSRPTMRFVPVKTADQQAAVLLHRGRERLVRQRTGLVNALRGHLAEFGVIAPQGLRNVGTLIAIVRDQADARLPDLARQVLQVLAAQIEQLEAAVHGLAQEQPGQQAPGERSGHRPYHHHSHRRHGGRTERFPQWARVRGLAGSGATAEFHRRQTSPGRDIQARQPIFAPASDQRRQR